ncbi:hypothetical protein F5Y07DRAFT_261517 [Xylaria sp. FL0933]|nr:hypothetical protein F5Y07DRAFT_261517 [Xylaria sp. FL0933]
MYDLQQGHPIRPFIQAVIRDAKSCNYSVENQVTAAFKSLNPEIQSELTKPKSGSTLKDLLTNINNRESILIGRARRLPQAQMPVAPQQASAYYSKQNYSRFPPRPSYRSPYAQPANTPPYQPQYQPNHRGGYRGRREFSQSYQGGYRQKPPPNYQSPYAQRNPRQNQDVPDATRSPSPAPNPPKREYYNQRKSYQQRQKGEYNYRQPYPRNQQQQQKAYLGTETDEVQQHK